MTFEEAKKILEKEGYFLTKVSSKFKFPELPVWEKQEVIEAKKIVNEHCFAVVMSGKEWFNRQERLKKEYEENTKAPDSGEEQPKEGNPALKEAASQFNDALLDEQAKKIEELTKEKTNLEDKIAILNACKEHNKNVNRKRIKRLSKEISKLNSIIHDKNAVLSDVAEELRLTKIRKKNLVELGLKYVGENEELKKELADKVVDKIDAQALKSAESALAWKEKVVADLGKELKATKKELEEKTKLVEVVRNASKEYCEYGVVANEFIKKLANLYVIAGNKGTISNEMFERCKNYQTYGFPANCNKETKKEIDDIARGKENKKPRISTPEISEEELMRLQEKVVASCDKAEEGGDQSATIVECGKGITLSKEEAEIIERCTKNGTELHYSEKDGFTYTNVFDEEMPIRCLRGMFHVFTDEEIENMKK
jgi:hypothetical protein